MNINLIYQNNSFNFDLRKDVSIKYIEDLASKLINKDKSFFNLSFKDNILSENPNTLLKDIVKTETNVPITITLKNSHGHSEATNILPKLKISNHLSLNNTESNETKNNLILNETELSQSLSENSLKVLQHISKRNFLHNKKKKKEYSTQNIVFEEIYNAKESELLSLLKNLTQKIMEHDDTLYKKFKKSFNKDNNELLLYEKNVINFKDKQIKFIKKLINYFENNEEDFLDEFYKELNLYDNHETIMEYKKKNNKLQTELLSPIRTIENNHSKSNRELPLLNNNKINNKRKSKLYLSEKKLRNDLNFNKIDNEEKYLFSNDKKKNKIKLIARQNPDSLFNSINVQEKSKTIEIQSNKNKNNKKNSIENTTNTNTNQSENSSPSKVQERPVSVSQNNIPIKLNKSTNSTYNKIINEKKSNNLNDSSYNINKNKNNYTRNDRNKERTEIHKRVNTIENIKYNRQKVSTLFEISESYIKENKDSDSFSESRQENSSDNKDNNELSNNKKNNDYLNDFDDIKNLKLNLIKTRNSKKAVNFSNIKNSKIGYLVKAKNRKVNQRIKKLGNNANDFLI